MRTPARPLFVSLGILFKSPIQTQLRRATLFSYFGRFGVRVGNENRVTHVRAVIITVIITTVITVKGVGGVGAVCGTRVRLRPAGFLYEKPVQYDRGVPTRISAYYCVAHCIVCFGRIKYSYTFAHNQYVHYSSMFAEV